MGPYPYPYTSTYLFICTLTHTRIHPYSYTYTYLRMTTDQSNLNKGGSSYLGKLRSNFVGTEFQVWYGAWSVYMVFDVWCICKGTIHIHIHNTPCRSSMMA
ncbi:hypothetical protein EON63_15350 [archaeon]|nr:MAG: hypothetical protein EON63_15350 [archaeon]